MNPTYSWLESFIPQVSWEREFWGNALESYVEAVLVFVGFVIVFKIVQSVVLGVLLRLAKKTKTDLDDVFVAVIGSIKPPFYLFLAFVVALEFLAVLEVVSQILTSILIIWVIYQVVLAVQILIDKIFRKKFVKEDNPEGKNAVRAFGTLVKVILWVFGLLFMLSNLGVEITSLIAGLGIGGIAVAFALQNILNDLFSSFAIYFDKPFVAGDFISIGEHSGTVERIGIKTTRIRALQGEEIVISNRELTSARVQNFKKLTERRVSFSLGVLYETEEEKLKKIPGMMREIINGVSGVRFDRAHFKKFGDSALIYEVVFFVESNDYAEYMDAQQEINYGIKKKFDGEGIGFAYPTQTIYVAK